jgi:hypothetical protein
MILEIVHLLLALAVMIFHKRIGDFILEQEERLVARLTQRGIFVPQFPSREFAHDLYFLIGVVVTMAALAEIWMSL